MLFKQLTDLGNLGIRQKLEIEQVMQCLVGREAGNILIRYHKRCVVINSLRLHIYFDTLLTADSAVM